MHLHRGVHHLFTNHVLVHYLVFLGGLASWRESASIRVSPKDAKTPRFSSGRPFTTRSIPSFISWAPKLRRNPSLNPLSFRYVRTCFECTLFPCSTDFNSRITLPSTTRSARKPSSNRIPP